jgi:transcriptional regulator with XRE-family HTH domain
MIRRSESKSRDLSIDKKSLGRAFRRLRLARGLSQKEVARAAGLAESGNSLALIERGERFVSLETLNALAEALDVPSACLAILGSAPLRGRKEVNDLMESLQKLVLATVEAQSELDEKAASDAKSPRGPSKSKVSRAKRRRNVATK